MPLSRELDVLGEMFSNRLLDAMRETAGASYTPFVSSSWPLDIASGGRMMAIGQLKPEVVPQFFAVADDDRGRPRRHRAYRRRDRTGDRALLSSCSPAS